MANFIVTTPLMREWPCKSEDEVREVIRDYMEAREGATLEQVTVAELFAGQAGRLERSPTDFWP